MNTSSEKNSTFSGDVLDVSGLLRLARENLRLIAACAIIFSVAAVGWTSFRGPTYEASAFLEIEDSREVATVAQKLRFPSVALKAVEDDESKARGLARRMRVKVIRDSRLVAVVVKGKDPSECASSADAIVGAFLELEKKSSAGAAADTEPVEFFDLPKNGAPMKRSVSSSYSVPPDVWQAEKATVPVEPTGPPNILLWAAAAVAGAFSGFVCVLLRNDLSPPLVEGSSAAGRR